MVAQIKKTLHRQKQKRYYRKINVSIAEYVDINSVELEEYVNLAHHAQLSDSIIGKRTSIGRYSKIQFADIGRYCSISWDVTIGALEHPIHSVSSHAFSYRKQFGLCEDDVRVKHEKVIIGNDVWIGCGAIIMPGVQVGDGAVIGAGGVVTKNVEPYEIVAGCPAKHLDWRFIQDTRDKLEKIQWWNWTDDMIKDNIILFGNERDIRLEDENVIAKMEEISKQLKKGKK